MPVVKPPSFAEIFGLDDRRRRRKKRFAQYQDNDSDEDFGDLDSMFDGEDEFFEAEDDFFDTINAVDNLDGQEEKESPGLR